MAEETANVDNLENLNMENFDMENLEKMLGEGGVAAAREKLLDVIKNGGLSEEDLESLKGILAGGGLPMGGYGGVTGTLLAMGLGGIIFSIIFFFGYKLYKSIRDKERKKEDKKKAKQQKKKK